MLGWPACSNSQWNRVMKKLEVHVIELAEWCYSEVVQANKTRGNNEHLHLVSTRLGVTILTLAQHPFMITEVVNSISLTDEQRPRHNKYRTSSGIISKGKL